MKLVKQLLSELQKNLINRVSGIVIAGVLFMAGTLLGSVATNYRKFVTLDTRVNAIEESQLGDSETIDEIKKTTDDTKEEVFQLKFMMSSNQEDLKNLITRFDSYLLNQSK